MISLSEIAKRAGVSVATVSLALRGKSTARATAERVRKIAEEMGYRPNPLLASLATKRFSVAASATGTPIAIFNFPNELNEFGNRSQHHPINDIVVREATALGYAPQIYHLENSAKPGPIFRELYHRMVQGVIISGSMDMNRFGGEFDWSHFSVVSSARYHTSLPFHTVRSNIFKGIKMCFRQLLSRGYKRIGFALGRHDYSIEDDEARHGAAIAMEYSYLPARRRLPVCLGSFNDEAALLEWVRKNKPDAVIGFTAWAYWILRSNGFRIPDELGFASLHVDKCDPSPFCAGTDENLDEIARQSVFLLDQLVRNKQRGLPPIPTDILVSPTWKEGETLRSQA